MMTKEKPEPILIYANIVVIFSRTERNFMDTV